MLKDAKYSGFDADYIGKLFVEMLYNRLEDLHTEKIEYDMDLIRGMIFVHTFLNTNKDQITPETISDMQDLEEVINSDGDIQAIVQAIANE